MQTYKKYKYSGVEWIGEIPEHWKTLRLRFVCELRNGYTPSKANPDFWSEGTIPWYRMEDIRESGRRLNEAKQYITESAIKGGGLFEAGSFIMATTATIGEHAVLIVDSLANQQFTNLKIRKSLSHSDFNAFFFQYLFVVDDYCKTTTKTATFPAVNMEDLKNFIVCIPPLDEQKIILTYLDKKCADIDKVIATQQRRIELLQELKQSTITHAVTRGLNPNVKMKDSGVEWIGEVPEHWNTLRLRFVCELRNGYTPSKANPDFWSEGTIPWYRMEDIRESGRRLNEAKQYITESAIKGGGLFEAGSFIMATTATIGEHAVLIVDSLANQQFTNLKIRKSLSHSDFNAFFFQYLFVVDDYCKTTTKTATFPAVNMEDLKNFIVCIPPLDEQKIILTYLDKRCAELDNSISKAQKEIDLLQEYKQALITEVVTGKRKVC